MSASRSVLHIVRPLHMRTLACGLVARHPHRQACWTRKVVQLALSFKIRTSSEGWGSALDITTSCFCKCFQLLTRLPTPAS